MDNNMVALVLIIRYISVLIICKGFKMLDYEPMTKSLFRQ